MQFRNDKLNKHLKTTNQYIRFGKPYIETIHGFLKGNLNEKQNRIIQKSFDVTDKVSEIIDTITK